MKKIEIETKKERKKERKKEIWSVPKQAMITLQEMAVFNSLYGS